MGFGLAIEKDDGPSLEWPEELLKLKARLFNEGVRSSKVCISVYSMQSGRVDYLLMEHYMSFGTERVQSWSKVESELMFALAPSWGLKWQLSIVTIGTIMSFSGTLNPIP